MKFDISVVIPTFNSEKFIRDAIESVLMQENVTLELIVVDGGSEDKTLEILSEYKKDISTIISEKDDGVTDALNKGLYLSSSDIVCWLNSDDVYVDKKALITIKKMFSNNCVDVVYGHSLAIDAEGYIKKTFYTWHATNEQRKSGANIFTGSLFFSKKAWNEFGGFSKKYRISFEHELLNHLLLNYRYKVINEIIGALRYHDSTLTANNSETIMKERLELLGVPSSSKLKIIISRSISLVEQGLFLRTLFNAFFDRNKHTHWRNFNGGVR